MKNRFLPTACALAAAAAMAPAQAQEASAPAVASGPTALEAVVVTGKRANRISKGATGLAMEIKDTPQSISNLDKEDITAFGATDSNEALRMATGINVEQYETNRAVFNSRGFEIQLTQIDGLGMTNDWGTVAGQQDTYLFERIELIRGANGLLTGVGNSSGTINYVRKRPLNEDRGEVSLTAGSYDTRRLALDYNKRLTGDGAWAGRVVAVYDDKDSYLRALHNKRSTLYGVVDGQIGENGVLTLGVTLSDSKQKSPMWGSLTLTRTDGTQADFDVSASTAPDWSYWNIRTQSVFAEYTHSLGADWEAKVTYNHRHNRDESHLLYAYTNTGALNPDDTGLIGWPYGSVITTNNDVLDANVSGQFSAWGRKQSLLVGASHSRQRNETDLTSPLTNMFLPLPAFPYPGNAYPEPDWGARTPSSSGSQTLDRVYVASRLSLTDGLKGIVGLNAIRLKREGSSIYGNAAAQTPPATNKVSPYAGLTYDITPDVLGYVSYSDIFQNQDQYDITGKYLSPMKGRNIEAGVKADWLGRKLLTTFAVFTAEQKGLGFAGGVIKEGPKTGQTYYVPKDVDSKGVEFEATGQIDKDTRLTLGLTRLKLTGPDGGDTTEWVPRTAFNFRYVSRVASLPGLELGISGRWQSDVRKDAGARQDAYLLAHGFAAYELNDRATLRLNVNNLFDKKYIQGLSYGAIYGAPRNVAVSLDYKL
ncbi:MAG: TonB-dependent siderophore receptor [Roseateles sp.]|uniref:TonB-dependent siderophore receptor n=1 Tax=Roseateles sp. TaxID=1971397 RepID=UPI0039E96584